MATQTAREIQVERREVLGKKVRQLRRQGLTPANIYGQRLDSRAVQLPTEEVQRLLRTVERNEIVYLRLDGEEPLPALIKSLQRNPVNDSIVHVDFQQVSLREKLKLDVPLTVVGESRAVEDLGGTLIHSLDVITVEGLPTEIPSHIEIDISVLRQIDQSLHVRDLRVPANIEVLTDPDVVVAHVSPPAIERELAAEAAAEEAAEEEAGGEEGAS